MHQRLKWRHRGVPSRGRARDYLFAGRLLLVWLLHVVDFVTDVHVAVVLGLDGRTVLSALSWVFLVLPLLLRWAMVSFMGNPCTPDLLGVRDENPVWCAKLSCVPFVGELVLVMDAIRGQWGEEHPGFEDRGDMGTGLLYVRLLEAAFEAMPQAVIQVFVLLEDWLAGLDEAVRPVQWISCAASVLAVGSGMSAVATYRSRAVHTGVVPRLYCAVFFTCEALLRISGMSVLVLSGVYFGQWGRGYFLVGYISLPLLFVTGICVVQSATDKTDHAGGRMGACSTHMKVFCLMSGGTLLAGTAAVFLPVDLAMGWKGFPLMTAWRAVEHLVWSLLCLSSGLRLAYGPLLVWGVCMLTLPRTLHSLGIWTMPGYRAVSEASDAAWSAVAALLLACCRPCLCCLRRRSSVAPGGDCDGTPRDAPAGDKGGASKPEPVVESEAWDKKVEALAHRGLTLGHLLDFYIALGSEAVMPHFDAERSTTNDVVRQAIIPLSRCELPWPELLRPTHLPSPLMPEGVAMAVAMRRWSGDGGSCSLERKDQEQQRDESRQFHRILSSEGANNGRAHCMVTHNWGNVFSHLVAGIVADALGRQAFGDIVAALEDARKCAGDGCKGRWASLRADLEASGALTRRYWVCAFSVDQHASICAGFGPAPAPDTPEFLIFDSKRRDTVTGDIYPLCTCSKQKHFNNHRDECELNKFDAMMAHLAANVRCFRQVVALDKELDLFSRAWCVAELVEARRLGLAQSLVMHGQASMPRSKAERLRRIRVQDCQASRPEDVEEILQKIPDKDRFNKELYDLLFADDRALLKDFVADAAEMARADLGVSILELAA